VLIGGLQPSSFVDYPGELAAVVFTHGCNLACGYCHNPQLVRGRPAQVLAVDEVLRWLEQRQGLLGAVVITGGEPTLQSGLDEFCLALRQQGFRVKLDTNGTRPEVLGHLLGQGLIDHVAMDLKDEPEGYAVLTGIQPGPAVLREAIATILAASCGHEFRTTVVHPRHDRARLLRMAELLRGAQQWWLQRYRPDCRLDPGFDGQPPDPAWLEAMAAEIGSVGVPCALR